MDEELRAYLEAMRRDFNDGQERLLNKITALEQDFQNTKGFLIGDALVSGRRLSDIEARLTGLERKAG